MTPWLRVLIDWTILAVILAGLYGTRRAYVRWVEDREAEKRYRARMRADERALRECLRAGER